MHVLWHPEEEREIGAKVLKENGWKRKERLLIHRFKHPYEHLVETTGREKAF
jgi:hypothetical protein